MFTGLSVRQFRRLVGVVVCRGGQQTGAGRRWGLSLADRVLLVAVYYRTNLTLRQIGPLFGVSKSAAGRIVDHLAEHLVLAEATRRHRPDIVLIVDGMLVPTHDRRVSARSKNYRYSANLQVVIDANTRIAVAVGKPLPGDRNDCIAYRQSEVDQRCVGAAVMADGGYQGNREVIMLYRAPREGEPALEQWQVDLNTVHRSVRACVEHVLAHMKSWKILRDCRGKGDGVWYAARAVALMRNLTMTV